MPNTGFTAGSPVDSPVNLGAHLQAATRAILGEPIMAIGRETGIGHNQARRIGTICGQSIEEFREQARTNAQRILALIDEMALEDIHLLKPMERQITYGIRMDKYRDLTGGNAPTSVHVTNIQVNGANRSEALALLTGARSSLQPSESPSTPIETPAYPVPETNEAQE